MSAFAQSDGVRVEFLRKTVPVQWRARCDKTLAELKARQGAGSFEVKNELMAEKLSHSHLRRFVDEHEKDARRHQP
jgi:hypothetical protein